jgi:hypothetical protein
MKASLPLTALAIVLALSGCSGRSDSADESEATAVRSGSASTPTSAITAKTSSPAQAHESLPLFDGGAASVDHARLSIEVKLRNGQGYSSRADLFMLDWTPAEIAFTGRSSNTGSVKTPNVKGHVLFADTAEVAKAYPKGLIVGAGLSKDYPSYPFGLTMINGVIYSPFDFSEQHSRKIYSGILCLTSEGQLSLLKTQSFVSNPTVIRDVCKSALQAFPILLDNSVPSIAVSEMSASGRRLSRVIIGINRQKRRFVLIFHDPVQLYPVAVLLSGQTSQDVTVTVKEQGENLGAVRKYLMRSRFAVNLPGADGALAIIDGQRVIGSMNRPLPAVLIFPTN